MAFPADPIKFTEAIRRFRQKVPMSDREWDALSAAAKERALKVTGVAQLDVIADVWRALDDSIAQGESLADFRKAITERLETEWQGSVANPPSRVETIFRTNVITSYSAGQYAQMTDPVVAKRRPYWLSETTEDQRQSDICKSIGRVILPADDPWWKTRWAPLHHQCRRRQTALTEREAKAMGITTSPPAVPAAKGFGRMPAAQAWEPDPADYPGDLGADLTARMERDGIE